MTTDSESASAIRSITLRPSCVFHEFTLSNGVRSRAVLKALSYKPEGRGFDSRWYFVRPVSEFIFPRADIRSFEPTSRNNCRRRHRNNNGHKCLSDLNTVYLQHVVRSASSPVCCNQITSCVTSFAQTY
jgi:hypothetical protein